MRGSVLLTIRESVSADLDHVCLNNLSHYSLDVTEFPSELYNTQSSFMDTIGYQILIRHEGSSIPYFLIRIQKMSFPNSRWSHKAANLQSNKVVDRQKAFYVF